MLFRRYQQFVERAQHPADWKTLCPDGESVHIAVVTNDQSVYECVGEQLRALPWVCGLRWSRSVDQLSASRPGAARRVMLADVALTSSERETLEIYCNSAGYDAVFYVSATGTSPIEVETQVLRLDLGWDFVSDLVGRLPWVERTSESLQSLASRWLQLTPA